MYRLELHPQEWIDRSTVINFTFEGKPSRGFGGDTISSALAVTLPYLGRSFKYHRPRGILSFANHDSNTLFQVDGVPNVRGDVTLLRDGMRVTAINTFGGLEGDKARILDRFARWLPVGFYYKAFHSKRMFPRLERMFRAITGLGAVSLGAERRLTPKRYGFCDVLVIGGGASGLAAALEAAAAGARVGLVDEAFRLGGAGGGGYESVCALTDAVSRSPRITVFGATVAAGYYADHWVALAEPTRMTKMRAKAVVFATGVIEQPAVFRNNDLPGVLLASGAWRLLQRYRVAPGRRVVMVAANLEAYSICLDLHAHGVRGAKVAGCVARLMRVGFVGELGYEIHVPANGASAVWQALYKAGLPRGLRPFGVEAQRVLRLEKGHLIVGQDTDGLTDPFEANARWAVNLNKPFFVGQRSLKILAKRGPRQKLVGIEILDPKRLPKESHLVIEKGEIAGRVTSVVHSRTLNKTIGLAMLAPQLAEAGGEIRIRADHGEMLAARVAATPFYDPQNLRQRAGFGA